MLEQDDSAVAYGLPIRYTGMVPTRAFCGDADALEIFHVPVDIGLASDEITPADRIELAIP